MGALSERTGFTANTVAVSSVISSSVQRVDDSSCDRIVGATEDWFPIVCKGLFESKAGTALHYITGFDERTCQRYAAGHTRITGDFLRALLRHEGGWTWLSAVMDGSNAQWWREMEALHELTIKYSIQLKQPRTPLNEAPQRT